MAVPILLSTALERMNGWAPPYFGEIRKPRCGEWIRPALCGAGFSNYFRSCRLKDLAYLQIQKLGTFTNVVLFIADSLLPAIYN